MYFRLILSLYGLPTYLSTLLVTLSSQKKMNEKLLLTIPNKKIFGDNSSQTQSAEKLGKNIFAKKSRQMKWINFTEYTFQFPWSEFVFKKVNLIQNSLNWFHKFSFWPGLLKNFWLAVRNQQIPSVSQESHTTMFSQSKKPILSLLTVIVCTGILSKNSWGEIGCKYVIHCRDWPSPTSLVMDSVLPNNTYPKANNLIKNETFSYNIR